ncbi:hypothetical protein [Streptomyces sp. WELS2]|uniref:hypothetical protein n=1 Tax=Streptomyces sp. WELS2 TaxID=2749435 RepID=UPI0015F04E84|nr:hypothetical protein [Streptomyces sp. WELS2]
MTKITEYRAYLEEFHAEVLEGLRPALAEHAASLSDLTYSEDDDGIWAKAVVHLPGRKDPWVRRRLIIPAQGPDKDAWLAGTIFSSALTEELDRRRT